MSGNFVDSNIFLYAFMAADEEKSEKAFSVIKSDSVVLSTQAVNEICVNLLKKSDYQEDDIIQLVRNLYEKYRVVIIDMNTILKASFLRKTYIFSYWDSLIIASALENDCSVLYSEDMQHGQLIEDRVKIINSFFGSDIEQVIIL